MQPILCDNLKATARIKNHLFTPKKSGDDAYNRKWMYSGSCTHSIAFRRKHTHGRICIYTYIYIAYVYLWHYREVWDKTERLWDDNPPTAPWRSIEIALKSSHHGWRISVMLLDWTQRQTQANPHSSHVHSCHRRMPPQFLFFFSFWLLNIESLLFTDK